MGRIEQRPASAIRARALATAVRKHDAGCDDCAEGYLEVARDHGATLEEMARAGMGRRRFLRLAAAVLAAGAAGEGFALAHREPPTGARATSRLPSQFTNVPGYFGVDSCTPPERATVAGMPLHFYIAELGATANGLNCFDVRTARLVGATRTHGYWGLVGPDAAPALNGGGSGTAPGASLPGASLPGASLPGANGPTATSAFGAQQAQAAVAAWQRYSGQGLIAGRTIFADVEPGFGGWDGASTPDDRAQVLDGFLLGIASAGFVPGVYINDFHRDYWFPSGYRGVVPFVYWAVAGVDPTTLCAPCAPHCDTLKGVATAWLATIQPASFAGQSAILWQYWPSDFGCGGDYTYSPQSGEGSFVPGPIPQQ